MLEDLARWARVSMLSSCWRIRLSSVFSWEAVTEVPVAAQRTSRRQRAEAVRMVKTLGTIWHQHGQSERNQAAGKTKAGGSVSFAAGSGGKSYGHWVSNEWARVPLDAV